MASHRDRAAEILRGPGGTEVYLSLLDYAITLASIRGWREGKVLPGGASPESITHEVSAKVLGGIRVWDDHKEPVLLNALKGMVRSEIGHLYTRSEKRLVESTNATLPGGVERTDDSFPVTALRPTALNPEEAVIQQENERLESVAADLLLKEIEGNDELESVFLALHEVETPSEISRLTGIPRDRIYVLRRQLIRIIARISPARVIAAARMKKVL